MTAAAVKKLQALPGGLTPENIVAQPEATIAEAIYPVGFWRRKAGYLQRTAAVLLEQHQVLLPVLEQHQELLVLSLPFR